MVKSTKSYPAGAARHAVHLVRDRAGRRLVFVFKTINRKVLDGMLGFAAGVMIAASFWSLLAPAIEMAPRVPCPTGCPPWSVSCWAVFSYGVWTRSCPHLHLGYPTEEAEGIKTTWQRSILLVLAITLHNIPEGLAVGVAFGAVAAGIPSASLAGAIALAFGIGIQNFPEGVAVSMPLRREGMSRLQELLVRAGFRHGGADRRGLGARGGAPRRAPSCPMRWRLPRAP